MNDHSMKKTYSKNWCLGLCSQCGEACANYCEETYRNKNQIKELLERIKTYEEVLDRHTKLQRLQKVKIDKYKSALEKIEDPRKRDHKEGNLYTELGCLMNIAHEALKE